MANVTDLLAGEAPKTFKRPPAFYDAWQDREGIPIYKQFHVEDLNTVELGHWERFGGNAAFVNLADPFLTSAVVLEIPPGKTLKPVRHMFETWVYIVAGRGETLIKQDGHQDQTVVWRERSLFGPPLNTTYQHRNLDSEKPARILMITNAPLTLNLYHNEKFVFDNYFVFDDRYRGEQGYFNPTVEFLGGKICRSNFIEDLREYYLHDWKERGFGNRTVFVSMSHHTIGCHISEFEVGTYKKAHRHGPGAHVILLQGTGYSLIWKEGNEPTRVDWREGSMFSPPDMYYHQHFNTGSEPARYLALKSKGNPEHPCRIGAPGPNSDPEFAEQHQIEHENEAPWIYDMYAEELKKNGMVLRQERPRYNAGKN